MDAEKLMFVFVEQYPWSISDFKKALQTPAFSMFLANYLLVF